MISQRTRNMPKPEQIWHQFLHRENCFGKDECHFDEERQRAKRRNDFEQKKGEASRMRAVVVVIPSSGQTRVYALEEKMQVYELGWSTPQGSYCEGSNAVNAFEVTRWLSHLSRLLAAPSLSGQPRMYFLGNDRYIHELGWYR